ncbi:MAG: hypothetical protein HZB29_10500 [Nitrospinae bacterium]|nr:hypothetical protein [Nitrospinota bacterium]
MSDVFDANARLPLPPEVTSHFFRSLVASTLKTFASDLNKSLDEVLAADLKYGPMVRKHLQAAMADALRKTMGGIARESEKMNMESAAAVAEEIKKIIALVEVDKLRNNYFGRVLVRQIDNYFPLRQDIFLNLRIRDEHVRGVIPRQIVGGLLQALRTVFGADFLAEKEELCNNIARKYMTNIRVVDWPSAFEDGESKGLVRQVFGESLKEKLSGKSRDWFMGVIKDNKSYREMRRGFGEEDYNSFMRLLFISQDDIRRARKSSEKIFTAMGSADNAEAQPAAAQFNEVVEGLPKEKRELFILQVINHKLVEAGPVGMALARRYGASGDKWAAVSGEMEWLARELVAKCKWFKGLPDSKDELVQAAYFRSKDDASRQYVQTRQALTTLNCPKDMIA